MTTPENPPAFPTQDTYHPSGQIEYGAVGMSLLDYYVGEAMKSLIQGGPDNNKDYLPAFDGLESQHDLWVAKRSFEVATAVLAERAKRKDGAA